MHAHTTHLINDTQFNSNGNSNSNNMAQKRRFSCVARRNASSERGGSVAGRHSVMSGPMPGGVPTASFTTTTVDLSASFADTSRPNSASGSPIVTRSWVIFDGTGSTMSGPNPTYQFRDPGGTYNVTLRVTDEDGKTSTATNQVTVPAPSTAENAPRFEAFPSETDGGTTVDFIDVSIPGASPATSWEWDFGDPSSPTPTSASRNPTHAYAEPGEYEVTLTTTTADGKTHVTTVAVDVYDVPPGAAQAAPDPRKPTTSFRSVTPAENSGAGPLSRILVDLSVPGNAGDEIVRRSWDFGDGTTDDGNKRNVVHTFPEAGNYTVTLVVEDSAGRISETSGMILYVEDEDGFLPPEAEFKYVVAGNTVEVVNSTFPGSNPVAPGATYDFGDGSPPKQTGTGRATHTYQQPGDYTVTITSTDDSGRTGTRSKIVTVDGFYKDSAGVAAEDTSALLPKPSFTHAATPSPDNTTVQFTDTSAPSTSTASPIVSWMWTFDNGTTEDGSTSTEQNPSRTFPAGGTYEVNLTVTDENGNSHDTTIAVTVAGNNSELTAHFEIDRNLKGLVEIQEITLDDTSTPIPGSPIVKWTWNRGRIIGPEGDPEVTPQRIESETYPDDRDFEASYPALGVYKPSLLVEDDQGRTAYYETLVIIPFDYAPTAKFTVLGNVPGTDEVQFADQSYLSFELSPIIQRLWIFGDGTVQTYTTGRKPRHAYAREGTYDVILVVFDAKGRTDNTTQRVNYVKERGKPTASYEVDEEGLVDDTFAIFTDTSTPNPETQEPLVKWTWDFGDGSPIRIGYGDAVAGYSYDNFPPRRTNEVGNTFPDRTGIWAASLTVEDLDGAKDTSTGMIVINVDP